MRANKDIKSVLKVNKGKNVFNVNKEKNVLNVNKGKNVLKANKGNVYKGHNFNELKL